MVTGPHSDAFFDLNLVLGFLNLVLFASKSPTPLPPSPIIAHDRVNIGAW